MGTMKVGSMCFTDLMEQAKAGHSAFSRAKNGKVYFNFVQWENDEADKFGNDTSFQLNSTKEKRDAEGKVYIGNSKPLTTKENTQPINEPINETTDGLPF